MSSRKKNGQNMLQWIIPTAILVIIILFTLTSYKSDILTREKNKKLDEYSSKAREIADYYSSEIYMIGQVARMLSTRVSVDHDYFCDDNVDLLTSAVSQLNIDAGYIVRNDGKVMNNMGVEAPNMKAATNGDLNIETGYVDEYIVNSSGDCVHYVSASFAEGSVILKYTPKPISDLELFLSSNAKTSTYILISSTGIILDSAGLESKVYKEGVDLFEYLDGAKYAGITKKDEFLKNLEQQNKGKVLITNKEGVPKYYIYQPIGDYKTFVMIIVDEAQITQAAQKGISSTTEMFWKIVVLILIFVAILVVISIINATNYRKANRELKEQAETDLLTDLYNKVATETKIKEYLTNEGKNKKSIMFVLDIDNFKKINDTMGHAFGDEVLSTLGHQIKSEFRINDIIGRTGGDEFIIFLKDLKDDAALSREAARVETFFKNFKVGEYTKYSATASIGVVEIPSDGTDFETLYKEADKALYLSKKRGKNQMTFYKDTKDIKIEPEAPVLKVVEETPRPATPVVDTEADKSAVQVEDNKKKNPLPSVRDIFSHKEEEDEVVTEEVKPVEPADQVSENKPEEVKPESKPEIEKAAEVKPVPETEVKKTAEAKPAPKTEVKKAEEVKPVPKTEVKKPVEIKQTETVQPQKKVVKKVVKRVVKKPENGDVILQQAVNPDITAKTVKDTKTVADKPAEKSTVPVKKVVKKVVKKTVKPVEIKKPKEPVKPVGQPKPEVKQPEEPVKSVGQPKPEVKKLEEPVNPVRQSELDEFKSVDKFSFFS